VWDYSCDPTCGDSRGRCARCVRFRRLGALRNQLLKQAKAINPDVLLLVDLDLWAVDIDGIADSFGREEKWNMMCSNGVYLHGLYWDTTAFRLPDGTRPPRLEIQSRHDKAGREGSLLPLASCFGGLGLYHLSAAQDCSYMSEWPSSEYMKECEHVGFNSCIHEKSGGVYSNPVMKVYYGPHHARRSIFPDYQPDWWCEPAEQS